jgi:hypothetical protein
LLSGWDDWEDVVPLPLIGRSKAVAISFLPLLLFSSLSLNKPFPSFWYREFLIIHFNMSTSPSRLTAREQPSLTTPSTAVSGLYSTEQSPREHTVSIAQSFTELIDRGALWDAAARCQQLASCKDAEDVLLSECDLLCQMMWRSLGHKVHPRALLGPFLLHACGSAIVERCCRTRLPALVNFVCAALDSLAATGESPKLHGSLLHVFYHIRLLS